MQRETCRENSAGGQRWVRTKRAQPSHVGGSVVYLCAIARQSDSEEEGHSTEETNGDECVADLRVAMKPAYDAVGGAEATGATEISKAWQGADHRTRGRRCLPRYSGPVTRATALVYFHRCVDTGQIPQRTSPYVRGHGQRRRRAGTDDPDAHTGRRATAHDGVDSS